MSWSTSIGGEIALKTLAGTGTLGERTSDFVEATRQFLGTDFVRRIALHRRLSYDGVETGIGLALPSLLAALADLASRPLGAGILACSVARQYPGALETIRNGIGGERQDVAAAYGWGYMAYLVGADSYAAACADIARVSKLGDQETKLLVGLVGWVLMSHLRLEQRRLDLSASRLADLLRCSCEGNLEDARGRSAPVGTLLFVHHRDASAKPTRTTRRRSGEGDPCVIHAWPRTIGIPSRGSTGTMLRSLPRSFRRRRTIRTGC
jgi:hypothetical protein